MTETVKDSVDIAIEHLQRSESGRAALPAVEAFITDHYLALDGENKLAVLRLIAASEGAPTTVRDAIRSAQ